MTSTGSPSAQEPGPETKAAASENNAEFYGKYPYPWPAASFSKVADRTFGPTFLNQELGYFTGLRVVPERIWVAGCGTNQAVLTALQYPDAHVLGTDLSEASLAFAQEAAGQLGIDNLSLARRDLQDSTAEGQFDLVICTGVIHHNPDPDHCLRRLRDSLAPDGVLELMVYNRHHRWLTGAFQEAIRSLLPASNLDEQLAFARRLMQDLAVENSMSAFLAALDGFPTEVIVDTLMQPLEHTFTVSTLFVSLSRAGLRLLIPRLNAIDALDQRSWNPTRLANDGGVLEKQLEALDDVDRWSVTSLLLAEVSPMLWFYVDRSDSPIPRRTERQIREDFLQARLAPYSTSSMNFVRRDGNYVASSQQVQVPLPRVPDDDCARCFLESLNGSQTSSQLMTKLGISPAPSSVDELRQQLSTFTNPYVVSV